MNKRLISFILSICMLLSLLPAGTLFAGAEDDTTVYAFNAQAYNVSDHLNFMELSFGQTGNLLAYNSSSKVASADGRVGARVDVKLQNTITESLGAYIAFDIKVKNDGVYDLSYVAARKNGTGLAGEVYIIPGGTSLSDLEAAKVAGIRIPCVNANGEIVNGGLVDYTTSIYLNAKRNGAILTAGTYILLLTCSDANVSFDGKYDDETSGYYMAPASFTLTRTGNIPPYELLPEKNNLSPGETTSLSVWDYNGNSVTSFDVVSVSSSDEDVATVDDSLTVTAGNKNGEAKIKATLGISGKEVEAEGIVDVENTDDYTGEYKYELSYSNYLSANDLTEADNTKLKIATFSRDTLLEYNNSEKVSNALLRQTPRFDIYLDSTVEDSIGAWFAFDIKLDRSGLYTSTYESYKRAADGMCGDVYLIPYNGEITDIQAAIDGGIKIASDVDYTANAIKYTKDKLYLTKGRYTVLISCTDKGATTDDTKTRFYMSFKQFSLEWNGLPINQLVPEKYHLSSGETVSLSVLDYKDDAVSSFIVKEISSSDEEIATVDGSTMTVTAGEKLGSAKISAVLTVDGTDIKSYGYVHSANTADSGKFIKLALDERKESWVNPGWERHPEKYSNDIARAQRDLVGFAEGDGITKEYTDGWSWYGRSNPEHKYNSFQQYPGSWWTMVLAEGEWAAIQRTIDAPGHYRAILNNTLFPTAGEGADVYIIPLPGEEETVEQYLTADRKISWFGCVGEKDTKVSTYLGEVYVDSPGEYLFVFRKNSKDSGNNNANIYVNEIILSGISPAVGMDSVYPGAITVGDKIEIAKDIVQWEADIPAYAEEAELTLRSLTEDVLKIDENGLVVGIGNGVGLVEVTVNYKGTVYIGQYQVLVGSVKNRRSYYTDDKVKNLRANIEKYDWAADERDAYVDAADKILENGIDAYYDMITTNELPRSLDMSYRYGDSGKDECVYCGENTYWIVSEFSRKWKVQCSKCKRLFPSNEFEKFYELGVDEHGNWRYQQALQKHHEMFVCADGENCECEFEFSLAKRVGDRLEIKSEEAGGFRAPGLSGEWKEYYGYGKGYLENKLYNSASEGKGSYFAVDDGWGYEYEYIIPETGAVETRCEPFIAYYNRQMWLSKRLPQHITNLAMAYLYTGEKKYGVAGAILLDRVADVWPDMSTSVIGSVFQQGDGQGSYFRIEENGEAEHKNQKGTWINYSNGKVLGRLHDCAQLATPLTYAYDALWPAFDEPEVVEYASRKAVEYDLANKKTTPSLIKTNIENNFIRELDRNVREFSVGANWGVTQELTAIMAVVLDTQPETQEWIDFNMQTGGQLNVHGRVDYFGYEYTGGSLLNQLYVAGRDGFITETAQLYNTGTASAYFKIAKIYNEYDGFNGINLYDMGKFRRIVKAPFDVLIGTLMSPNVGDNYQIGAHNTGLTMDYLINAYDVLKDDPEYSEHILKLLYIANGYSEKDVHTSIFDENPEEICDKISEAVENGVMLDMESRNITGYGMAILRGGDWLNSKDRSNNINTQHGYYIYYGQRANSHVHADALVMNAYAYGFPVVDDLGGLNVKVSNDAHRHEFLSHTISHNTVTVDERAHYKWIYSKPLHFDSTERVSLMDVSVPGVYAANDRTDAQFKNYPDVEDYRRTVVTVEANDDVAYAVDFFHVSGGDKHTYSFHGTSNNATVIGDNVEIVSQKDENGKYIGSVQGMDKPWKGSNVADSVDTTTGEDVSPDGLGTMSWFGEVDKVKEPENAGVFSVDWKVADPFKVLKPAQKDLRVRLTMLNDFKLDGIITASGPYADWNNDNFTDVRFLLAEHTGKADGREKGEVLESLYTSVIEPYKGLRYIEKIEPAVIEREDGSELAMEEAKAVKVTLTTGREDYIVYAKDTTIPYKVTYSTPDGDKTFDFKGFVGVVSVMNGIMIYSYLNDGEVIADKADATAAYIGKVVGFQTDAVEDNYIDVEMPDQEVDLSCLSDQYIYIDSARLKDNKVYRIIDAKEVNGAVRLNIGDVTLITNYADINNFDKGYKHNIAIGENFRIPLNYVDDTAPVITTPKTTYTTSAGSSVSFTVEATSEVSNVTFNAVRLPRGASLNPATGVVTWKPDSSQVGNSYVTVEVFDEFGRTARETYEITVYGATTGNEGTSGGGGGGGGVAPTDKPEASDDQTDLPPDENTDEEKNTAPDASGETDVIRFTDLSNHAWAADAINTLADNGVIKGTTASTYSPASNISRADFALLLVRAFELESDNTENFADVKDSDYFAPELAIARNTGIVNGIGDNKFAPRNTITRQDMMVIVYRALQSQSLLLEEKGDRRMAVDEVLPQYSDFANVADYAKDAVSALIGTGLVNGKSGCIAPNDYTTRAEVAVLIKRIIDYTK